MSGGDGEEGATAAVAASPPYPFDVRCDLLERFEGYTFMDARPSTARLADAVINGADDIVALRADAMIEASATPMVLAEANAGVRSAVLGRLLEIYAPHARPNYEQLATDYDGLAQKFTAAADLVNPETDAADGQRIGEDAKSVDGGRAVRPPTHRGTVSSTGQRITAA